MNMKKLTTLLLAFMLAMSMLVGCSSAQNPAPLKAEPPAAANSTETGTSGVSESDRPTEGSGKIGFSVITLGTEFFATFDKELHEKFEAGGYEVITLSCEANPVTQISDIENMISMNVEAIILFVIDPAAITDVLVTARESGIKVYPIAATMENQDAYDAILGTDQFETGATCAEMAVTWMDAAFPDAEDGSIDTVILVDTTTGDGVMRADGLKTVTELSSKINIAEVFDLAGATDMNLKAQEYAEMAVGKYPNLKLVLSCSTSLGFNEVYMRENGLDRSKFGIFGIENTQLEYQAIKQSLTDESLVRGAVCFSRGMGNACWNVVTGVWDDLKDATGHINEPCEKVTPQNVDDFIEQLLK